jgi:DNA-binding NtrC family response regulator
MLSAPNRDFFSLLSEAAFTNPFSTDRDRIDRRLAAAPRGMGQSEILGRLLARVRDRLRGLATTNLRRYPAEERVLVEQAILFDVFHRVADSFDALIQDQLAKGAKSVPVPFGRETLAALARAGFDAADARRYFELFYQLRRAFHFIEHTLSGASPSMRHLRERLWANVFTHDARLYARLLWRRMEDFSTFLLGETGTGKGIAAAAIGRSGWIPYDETKEAFAESFVDSFLSINLSQFPEALIESELFGHKKGAFTGAIDGHAGVFARCSPHGSIFLDEIGEIGAPVQIKLLRVLQERVFSPVGGHETARFSGRVIAATNRSLDDLRARGDFRDDFYYRLCSDVIEVPSLAARLREDPTELDALLAFILRRVLGEDSPDLRVMVRGAIDRDLGPEYPWPGNVRELEQCVRRVVLTRGYAGDRLFRAAAAASSPGGADTRLLEVAGEQTAKGLVARYCKALYVRHGTYEEVARRTGLDRRTVKAHVTGA